jgi:hypothetical protein
MIRINLLGQTRPKASRRPVDTGAALPLVFIGAGVLLGGLFLFYFYHSWQTQLNDENKRIQQLQAQKRTWSRSSCRWKRSTSRKWCCSSG